MFNPPGPITLTRFLIRRGCITRPRKAGGGQPSSAPKSRCGNASTSKQVISSKPGKQFRGIVPIKKSWRVPFPITLIHLGGEPLHRGQRRIRVVRPVHKLLDGHKVHGQLELRCCTAQGRVIEEGLELGEDLRRRFRIVKWWG